MGSEEFIQAARRYGVFLREDDCVEHLHVSVTENSRYTDRKKCFRTGNVLEDAKEWLRGEMTYDSSWVSNSAHTSEKEAERITEDYTAGISSLEAYEGEGSGWLREVKTPGTAPDTTVTFGYMLMESEPCEDMSDD